MHPYKTSLNDDIWREGTCFGRNLHKYCRDRNNLSVYADDTVKADTPTVVLFYFFNLMLIVDAKKYYVTIYSVKRKFSLWNFRQKTPRWFFLVFGKTVKPRGYRKYKRANTVHIHFSKYLFFLSS